MNILMVCNGAYPDEIGGAHTYVYELAKHLAALGHQLTILTRRASAELPTKEMIDGIRYVRYDYNDSPDPVRWRYKLYFGARSMFDSLVGAERFDVIHGHWPHSTAGVFEHPVSKASLRVYTLHAPFFEEEQIEAAVLRRDRPFTARQILKRMWVPVSLFEKRRREYKVLRKCSLVFVLSKFMRGRARDCFAVPPGKLEVIPGGVDTRRFFPAESRESVRARLGIPAETKLLLTVRRLVPRMGLKNIVKAMAIVKRHQPRALLCIGGTGILYEDLKSLIRELSLSDAVRLLGFIPVEGLADHYRAADYFIVPTEFLEGFGLSTIEAMACGTPVLGTAIGGTGEILGSIDRGLLFSGTEPRDMAEGILRHLNSESRAGLGEKVARYAHKVYAWEIVARWIEETLLARLAQ